ncbi:pentatricopeptide repeat-containing protein At4g21300 [Selaginella moellendorffii]|nr:pentatricopeptide repeat-containing protein At4g21300 [Selaginella moellendorffii]|eukprot:XP_002976079.2 pentatricopeptide repeat-containing protein At4g21300 [Selaginella moellendorffii]
MKGRSAKRSQWLWRIFLRSSSSASLDQALGRLTTQGSEVTSGTYASLVRQCGSLGECKLVHRHIMSSSKHFQSTYLSNLLIQMYGKCGYLDDAIAVFKQLSSRNVYSYNIMVAALVQNARLNQGLQVFQEMLFDGIKPDVVSFVTVLGACSSVKSVAFVYKLVYAAGLESNVVIATSVINLYGRSGGVRPARELFDRMTRKNAVTWNSMIAAYAQNGHAVEAMETYKVMDVEPDEVTFVNVLGACWSVDQAKKLHEKIVLLGFETDVVVGTALVTIYGKFGLVQEAEDVFERIREKNLICWTAMLSAYVDHGFHSKALETYQKMRARAGSGLKLDAIVFVSALNACSSSNDLEVGKQLHADMIASKIKLEGDAAASLVNMYGKCGSLAMAREVFDRLVKLRRDIVLWNTMLLSYAQSGLRSEAVEFLWEMTLDGTQPNEISFTGVLYACCHGGVLEQGREHFQAMLREYEISPVSQHFGCMADLFARLGKLGEAEELLRSMPYEPEFVMWTALLGACRNYGDSERAARLAESLSPETSSSYVLLSGTMTNV